MVEGFDLVVKEFPAHGAMLSAFFRVHVSTNCALHGVSDRRKFQSAFERLVEPSSSFHMGNQIIDALPLGNLVKVGIRLEGIPSFRGISDHHVMQHPDAAKNSRHF